MWGSKYLTFLDSGCPVQFYNVENRFPVTLTGSLLIDDLLEILFNISSFILFRSHSKTDVFILKTSIKTFSFSNGPTFNSLRSWLRTDRNTGSFPDRPTEHIFSLNS